MQVGFLAGLIILVTIILAVIFVVISKIYAKCEYLGDQEDDFGPGFDQNRT